MRTILAKQLECVFLRNVFGFERHCVFFPLVYFMQNHKDMFQDYLGKV